MERDKDISGQLAETVREAAAHNTALAIPSVAARRRSMVCPPPGNNSTSAAIAALFPTNRRSWSSLRVPGMPLADIETALAEKNQMTGFEPPHFARRNAAQIDRGEGRRPGRPDGAFAENATLGGAIACGLGSAPSPGRERARLRVGHKNPERQGRNSALRRTGNHEKRRRFRCLAADGRGAWHLGRTARKLA